MSKEKLCKCKEPGHPPSVPGGIHKWKGKATCSNEDCGGTIHYPIDLIKEEDLATDPVDRYVQISTAKSKEQIPDAETAVIVMLRRLEKLTMRLFLALGREDLLSGINKDAAPKTEEDPPPTTDGEGEEISLLS